MSIPTVIIITRPPPTGGRAMASGNERHEFPNTQEAIAFLQAIDEGSDLPEPVDPANPED